MTSRNGQARQIHRGASRAPAPGRISRATCAPGGAKWTRGRHCGGFGPLSSHVRFWAALLHATCSPHRPHRNGRGPTHRILFPTTFRIEPNDKVCVGIFVRPVWASDQPQPEFGPNRPCGSREKGPVPFRVACPLKSERNLPVPWLWRTPQAGITLP